MISIVVPTYKKGCLLGETLSSIAAQSSPEWRCLIVDDSQRDEPPEEITSFLSDERFSWLKREGERGANGARNTGLRASESELVSFLDDDDLVTSDYVRDRLNFMRGHQGLDFWVFPNYAFRNEPGDMNAYACFPEKARDSDLARLFKVEHPWITSGVLWSKSFLLGLGGWNEQLCAWQDWELNARALLKAPSYERSQKGDSFRRKGAQNRKTISSSKRSFDEMDAIRLSIMSVKEEAIGKALIGSTEVSKCFNVFLKYASIRMTLSNFLRLSLLCFSDEQKAGVRRKCLFYFLARKIPILKNSDQVQLLLPTRSCSEAV